MCVVARLLIVALGGARRQYSTVEMLMALEHDGSRGSGGGGGGGAKEREMARWRYRLCEDGVGEGRFVRERRNG